MDNVAQQNNHKAPKVKRQQSHKGKTLEKAGGHVVNVLLEANSRKWRTKEPQSTKSNALTRISHTNRKNQ